MQERPPPTPRWFKWIIFVLALFCLAQRVQVWPSQPSLSHQDPIRIKVELVVLHVTVLNRERLPTADLGRTAFQVYEDGTPQEIESFRQENIPVTVGLVVDNSGSMQPKRREVIAAALAFAQTSNPHDQHFLINFNERVSFGLPAGLPFTADVVQLEAALATITAQGKTALYDAIAAALLHAKKGKRDKQVLIVVSDGADNASQYDASRLITLAKQSDAIIYTIGVYDRNDPDRNPGALKQLARATGGEAFWPQSAKEATAICQRIARDIRSQYTLAYTPTNLKHNGNYRAIKVEAKAFGGQRLYVRTRAGYYAPMQP